MIDASIPLQATANPPSLLRSIEGAQRVRQNDLANQQGQQGLQAMTMQNQVTAQQIRDSKLVSDAYVKNNGDLDKTIQDAARSGVSPDMLQKLQMHSIDVKSKTLDMVGKQGTVAVQQADLMQGAHDAVAKAPPAERPALYQQQYAGLQKAGLDVSQLPAQYPGDQAFSLLGAAVTGHTKQVQDAAAQLELANKTAMAPSQLLKSQSDAQLAQAEAAQGPKQSEVSLAVSAAKGDKTAADALKRLDESKRASRPVTNIMSNNDAKDIADAIQNGDQPPTLTGLYKNAGPVRAELARRGVPLAKMETDWKATQKYITTLNGSQQVRLRQAITTATDSLSKIESLYGEWQKLAPTSGFKVLNHGALIAMKNVPGRAGAVATALDAQIADLTSELGNVYMGGNSPTDHSLSLAKQNLSSDWNNETFAEGIKQARLNLGIRTNSIMHAQPAGTSSDSTYYPKDAPPTPSAGGFDWNSFPTHQ